MKTAYAHTDQALSLLREWLAGDPPWQLDRFIAQAMKRDTRLGRRDRQALSEAVFAFVRYASLARAVLAEAEGCALDGARGLEALRPLGTERALAIVIARYGREQWPLRGAGNFLLGERIGAAFEMLGGRAAREFPAFLLWHGIDPAWEPALRERAAASGWDDAALRAFVVAQESRPPLWLRLNHEEGRAGALAALRREYRVEVLDEAIAIHGARGIQELDCWKSGDVEIQDLASQQVGRVVAAKPGETVWDACAGGGGKTLQLAAMMRGRGAVHASDIRARVLDEISRRARRARLHNIRTFVWNGEFVPPLPREAEKRGGFDAVLVDAPCTGSGTWRRNPDARHRHDGPVSESLGALQSRLLSVAAGSVRPGGRLVYATCSFRVEENESVVARFLAESPDFSLEFQSMLGAPAQDSDAMFAARLRRRTESGFPGGLP